MFRTDIVVLLLAVSLMDIRAEEPIQNMNVSLGNNVLLPCPCSEDTKTLVWQIGEDIVVNTCCEKKHEVHNLYKGRTQVILNSTKGNCSLLLHNVTVNDGKIFTCHFFGNGGDMHNMHAVRLKIEEQDQEGTRSPQGGSSSITFEQDHQATRKGFSVGVPLSVIILAVVILAVLFKKYRQRRPRTVMIHDPQVQVPIMNHTPL